MHNTSIDVRVHNQIKNGASLPFEWGVELPPSVFNKDTLPGKPYTDDQGIRKYPIPFPTSDDHHIALGTFMDAWSRMEITVHYVFSILFKTDRVRSSYLTNSMRIPALSELLVSLATLELSADLQLEMNKLADRLKKLNTSRNKIVHGVWTLEAVVDIVSSEPRIRSRLYRFYPPSDPLKANQILDLKNQKVRADHYFTVKQIDGLRESVWALRNDFGDFSKKLPR
ncbi:hypothetical protein FS764_16415 [Agrobacterium vitis]|uniref:hypothetical protein n=1 Tax=Agrobacterium vitis TaxID=373 RepID=UPI001F3B907F|nr:hypothetical protein [Agrobacterium vitis]MCF1468492.1 hypothetical protein [Agrobacterium vitis]